MAPWILAQPFNGCLNLLPITALKFAVICCSATLTWIRRTTRNYLPCDCYYHCLYEAKLYSRKLMILLFFRQWTPSHLSAWWGRLETCRLLVESKADVGATDATSSWWSLGGAGIGRSRECIQASPRLKLTAAGRRQLANTCINR